MYELANKFWSGLLEDYYLPRASTYFDYLLKSLTDKQEFRFQEWNEQWISFSNNWQAATNLYPVKAKGDSVAISKALYSKYFG